jgi:hypothetical protein
MFLSCAFVYLFFLSSTFSLSSTFCFVFRNFTSTPGKTLTG